MNLILIYITFRNIVRNFKGGNPTLTKFLMKEKRVSYNKIKNAPKKAKFKIG